MKLFDIPRGLLFALDAERAHRLTIRMLAAWARIGSPFAPARAEDPVTIAGLTFPNRVGLAAGVDKDAEAIDGLLALGFGHVEVGTLTPRPQPGNPQPRLFRLVEDRGIINRMGFNNGGIATALPRIAAARREGVLGVNVGANKDATDRVADYVVGITAAAEHADYITINVSSPNTPGLRDLQARPALDELLAACDAARSGATRRPLFLKVAPDLDDAALAGAIEAALANHIDALIVGNTTISRPELLSAHATETGGLSGAPLASLARTRLQAALKLADGAIPIISVGGIDSPAEAHRRIDMGATMVQLYSALVYEGPGLAARIARALAE